MKLPKRDDWVRIGYSCMGGGVAVLWDRYLPLSAKGGGYLPPVALATLMLLSEDAGDIEKDIAAGILGYSSVAQAISYAEKFKKEENLNEVPISISENSITENPTGLDVEAQKLQKIRAVTGTLGALADIVGKFKGNG